MWKSEFTTQKSSRKQPRIGRKTRWIWDGHEKNHPMFKNKRKIAVKLLINEINFDYQS
jgi:hypothetical protein